MGSPMSDTRTQARACWEPVVELLQHRIPRTDFYSWFALVEPVEFSDSRLVLSFANDFAVQWVRERFTAVVQASIDELYDQPIELVFVSRETGGASVSAAAGGAASAMVAPADNSMTIEQLQSELMPTPAQSQRAAEQSGDLSGGAEAPSLNDRYRFDTFVIGEANQLAHAAALSVAEAPGQSYNPLFIHGPTGLGKTHLLHAIGHYARETRPGIRVAYATTEQFVNRFIAAIQKRDTSRQRFKDYFRGIDILLMDDVQFLSGKGSSTQEELFHTFNALHEAGKQVVLTSDSEPSQIPQLEERLKSRFSWGLLADIAAPDHATRVAILRKRGLVDGVDVPDDVLSLIAERVSSNVRELEGALTRVVGFASLTGRDIDGALAASVLDSYGGDRGGEITIDRIQDAVCKHFSLTREDLVGARRSNEIARPRQIAMYLARVLLGAPSTHVGRRFGGRDHSTVLYAERRIDTLIRNDREVYDLVEQLTSALRGGICVREQL